MRAAGQWEAGLIRKLRGKRRNWAAGIPSSMYVLLDSSDTCSDCGTRDVNSMTHGAWCWEKRASIIAGLLRAAEGWYVMLLDNGKCGGKERGTTQFSEDNASESIQRHKRQGATAASWYIQKVDTLR